MRRLFAAARDLTGNLPPLPGVYPDSMAPIVRMVDGERQLGEPEAKPRQLGLL